MADRWIDTTLIRAHLGTGYSSAALAVTGVSESVLVESCTALVKSAMKNSGYPLIATQDPSTVDELAKLAVLEVFRWKLANIPEAQLPLPVDWETSLGGKLVAGIIEGTYPMPSLDPSTLGSVGGSAFTDPLISTNAARKTTKDELAGY